jgi:hypothetical protein
MQCNYGGPAISKSGMHVRWHWTTNEARSWNLWIF